MKTADGVGWRLTSSALSMFEQFFLGLALLGCLAWGYRLLAVRRPARCPDTYCNCETIAPATADAERHGQ